MSSGLQVDSVSPEDGQTDLSMVVIEPVPRSKALIAIWAVLFGSFIVSFPLYTFLAFGVGWDRQVLASMLVVQGCVAFLFGFSAGFWPLPSLRSWTWSQRLKVVAMTFVIVDVITNLSWEVGWMILHSKFPGAENEAWAYPWYIYIDGGDYKYLTAPPDLVALETISIAEAVLAGVGVILLFRSRFQDVRGTLLVMAGSVIDLTITSYYYLHEIFGNFASVNTHSVVDLWGKFIILNALWLIGPWIVLYWGYRFLPKQYEFAAKRRAAESANASS